jgi:hypothetical protein
VTTGNEEKNKDMKKFCHIQSSFRCVHTGVSNPFLPQFHQLINIHFRNDEAVGDEDEHAEDREEMGRTRMKMRRSKMKVKMTTSWTSVRNKTRTPWMRRLRMRMNMRTLCMNMRALRMQVEWMRTRIGMRIFR